MFCVRPFVHFKSKCLSVQVRICLFMPRAQSRWDWHKNEMKCYGLSSHMLLMDTTVVPRSDRSMLEFIDAGEVISYLLWTFMIHGLRISMRSLQICVCGVQNVCQAAIQLWHSIEVESYGNHADMVWFIYIYMKHSSTLPPLIAAAPGLFAVRCSFVGPGKLRPETPERYHIISDHIQCKPFH